MQFGRYTQDIFPLGSRNVVGMNILESIVRGE